MTTAAAPGRFARSFVTFAGDIKLAHSVFALPFAAAAVIIGRLPLPDAMTVAVLVACMVTARTFAMGMNRWLDHRLDALNPRTAGRSIPSGRLSAHVGLTWSLISAGLFIAAASLLNQLALLCAVPLLVILAGYSLMKRVSWLTHFYLGACLGLAPIAVSVALVGEARPAVLALGLAITFWTAGFDCLYALQDMDFDRQQGLHSVPQRFGPRRTYGLAAGCFATMVAILAVVGWLESRGLAYGLGVGAVAAMLGFELWLVRDARLTGRSRNMSAAFFTANAWVSVLFFSFCVVDALL